MVEKQRPPHHLTSARRCRRLALAPAHEQERAEREESEEVKASVLASLDGAVQLLEEAALRLPSVQRRSREVRPRDATAASARARAPPPWLSPPAATRARPPLLLFSLLPHVNTGAVLSPV